MTKRGTWRHQARDQSVLIFFTLFLKYLFVLNWQVFVGWKTLQSQRKISRLILFNKGINDLAVLPLHDLTEPSRRFRNMHSMYYRPIFARTNIYKYSFLPRTITDWNQLPQEIINLNSSTSFKDHIVDFIDWLILVTLIIINELYTR